MSRWVGGGGVCLQEELSGGWVGGLCGRLPS